MANNAPSRIPGGIELNKLHLETSGFPDPLNLERVFREVHIYEDLYSNFLTGHISLSDASNIIKNSEITGHEELTVKFKGQDVLGTGSANSDWIDLSFKVSGISERVVTGERQTTYSLDFISKTAYTNSLDKVSKGYKGSIPEIATKICTEYLKEDLDVYITSSSPFQCIIPYWSPISAVNWLTERCVADTPFGSSADCLFYEDRGGLVLTSLSELKKQGPNILDAPPAGSTLYFQPAGAGGAHNKTKQRSVSGFTVQPSYKTLDYIQSGVYSSQVISHDITRKKIQKHKVFRYDTDFARRPGLEKFNMLPSSGTAKDRTYFTEYPNASYLFQPKNAHLFGNALPPTHVKVPESWVAQRLSQLGVMKNIIVGVKLPGDTMLKLGTVVRWKNFPSPEEMETPAEMPVDEFLSGDFLITAIHHMLTPAHYYVFLELTKDSLAKDLS